MWYILLIKPLYFDMIFQHHNERATNLSQFSQYTPPKQQPVTDQFVASTSSSQFGAQPGQHNQFAASTPAYQQQQQHVPDVSVTPIHRDSRDRISTQVNITKLVTATCNYSDENLLPVYL